MHNPEHIIVYEVTCPRCGCRHHIYGWHPKYCPWCRFDIGGCSQETLQAQEHYYKLALDALSGKIVILSEAV